MISTYHLDELKQLELQLFRQEHPVKRQHMLDALAAHYVFTNVQKAQDVLQQQEKLLLDYPNPDLQLNYHMHAALMENQLYFYSEAEQHFLAALELIEERGNVGQQAEVLIDYSGTCLNQGRSEKAIDLLERSSRLLEMFPDDRLKARFVCREGVLSLHISNYTQAIEQLMEADKRFSLLTSPLLLKDYYFLTILHSGLGTIYQQNGEIEKSVKANLQVLDICNQTGMRHRLSWHYLNVGRGYIALNDPEKAEDFFRKAVHVADDNSRLARAGAYANLGYCAYMKAGYKEALKLFELAEDLYDQTDHTNYSNLFFIESWRAKVFANIGDNNLALEHFSEALEYARNSMDYKQLSIICKEISQFFAGQEDYKNAYDYLQVHNDMLEQYQEERNARTLMEIEVKYETEKKRREAEMLRLQATSLQLKALRAQMNPHFIYNALNSIQHYITSKEVTSAAKYLAKFAKLMRQSLDYSDQEIITLEEEIEFLRDYLEINQKLRFEDDMDYSIYVNDEIEEDIMGVPTMIVQPYVENAIEHGLRNKKNGLVKLEFFLKEENVILCIVEDNGIGRAKAAEYKRYGQNHRSKGTSITEKRLEVLHKSRQRSGDYVKIIDLFDEKTGAAAGTRVEVEIPIMEIQMKN